MALGVNEEAPSRRGRHLFLRGLQGPGPGPERARVGYSLVGWASRLGLGILRPPAPVLSKVIGRRGENFRVPSCEEGGLLASLPAIALTAHVTDANLRKGGGADEASSQGQLESIPHRSRYLTVREAARLLAVSPSAIWWWIQAEELRATARAPGVFESGQKTSTQSSAQLGRHPWRRRRMRGRACQSGCRRGRTGHL